MKRRRAQDKRKKAVVGDLKGGLNLRVSHGPFFFSLYPLELRSPASCCPLRHAVLPMPQRLPIAIITKDPSHCGAHNTHTHKPAFATRHDAASAPKITRKTSVTRAGKRTAMHHLFGVRNPTGPHLLLPLLQAEVYSLLDLLESHRNTMTPK